MEQLCECFPVLTMKRPTLGVPSECDIDGHFVDFSLLRQAVVAGVGQKDQPCIVGEHGVVETQSSTLQSNKSLRYTLAS